MMLVAGVQPEDVMFVWITERSHLSPLVFLPLHRSTCSELCPWASKGHRKRLTISPESSNSVERNKLLYSPLA